MTYGRYDNVTRIAGGKVIGTTTGHVAVRNAATSGRLSTKVYVLQEGERLDILAGREYGNARYWWVIAAASGVGWGLQVPPGTRLIIPTDLNQVLGIV
jgi:nucleoid-associated protein YgaU